MIKPVNGHLIIEPVVHDSFISSEKERYEEMGIVVDMATVQRSQNNYVMDHGIPVIMDDGGYKLIVKKGDKVYFDSWLAAKYPKGDKPNEFYWLVKWEDVRAVEHEEIPE